MSSCKRNGQLCCVIVVIVVGAITQFWSSSRLLAGECLPPIAVAEGSRYIAVTPQPPGSAEAVALFVTSVDHPCIAQYVTADGFLVDEPVFLTPGQWGTVHVADLEIVPSTEYSIMTDCGGAFSSPTTATTWLWADANNDEVIDFDDILCVLDGFSGSFSKCSFYAEDIFGEVPNRRIDFDDILAVLNAFGGDGYPFPITDEVPMIPVLDPHPATTAELSITITGIAQGADAVRVSSPAGIFEVVVESGNFTANVVLSPDMINAIYFTALATSCAGPSAPAATFVTNDTQPPNLFIDFPLDEAEITTVETDVAGRVGDLLSGFMGLTVTVNGIDAVVDVGIGNNGTFFAPNVPLVLGDNTITAIAIDFLGNTQEKQITVIRVEIPPDAPQIVVVSGNGQTAQMGTILPEPIVVLVTHGDGTPFANKLVTFDVTRSNGRLTTDGRGDGSMMLQLFSDAAGEARAFWQIGFDAGCGNNRVEVTSNDIIGTTFFCASATPAPAGQINVGSGNNQRAETGAPAPEPLRVWVSDACNGVPDIPVTFTVTLGGGKVNAQDQVMVPTGVTGHAEVEFTLGPDPGNNIVQATFPTNRGLPARFVVYGLLRDLAISTSFSGIVLNNADQPIQGAECTLIVAELEFCSVSDIDGRFQFDELPGSGPADLIVDGLAAFHVGGADGHDIPPGSYPTLHFEPIIVPNAANSLATPVLLPPLNPNNAFDFDNTQDVELTVEGIDGLKMIVRAGSMTLANGTVPSPADPATITLNQVRNDDVPMPMPDGAAPPFAWTLQPGGATFDPPIEIIYPNMSGLPAGSIAWFLSFNHDTMRFEIVASGSVTDDGQCIVSDPGAGISVAGWGCNCPPYFVTGDCCNPTCGGVCCPDTQPFCCNGGCCSGPCCADGECCADLLCCGNPSACCIDTSLCCINAQGQGDCCENCCNGDCCDPPAMCCDNDHCCPEFRPQCCDNTSQGFLGCCLAGQTCCEADCCLTNVQECCGGTECCSLFNEQCCTDHCCPQLDECCGDGCCAAGSCCGNECCESGEVCCGDHCCPANLPVCCDKSEGFAGCCSPNSSECCADSCCTATQSCCDDANCCETGEECCNGDCCPIGQNCCGGTCCEGQCVAGECCEVGDIVCSDHCCESILPVCCDIGEGFAGCCLPNTQCCGNSCCVAGEVCVDGQCQ